MVFATLIHAREILIQQCMFLSIFVPQQGTQRGPSVYMVMMWECLWLVVMCTEDVTFPTSEDCTYLETMGVGMLQIALQLAYGADYRAVPKKKFTGILGSFTQMCRCERPFNFQSMHCAVSKTGLCCWMSLTCKTGACSSHLGNDWSYCSSTPPEQFWQKLWGLVTPYYLNVYASGEVPSCQVCHVLVSC